MLEVFKNREIRVTLHAVKRFLSRYNGTIPSNTYKFLTDRVNDLLEGKIPSVELVRKSDQKDYNLKHPTSISLYDLELSLIFVISYEDFSLLTIRKDLHNFKKPRNNIIKKNVISNWIPVVDKDNIDYVYKLISSIKKYPETFILYNCTKEELIKKNINKCFKHNISNVIEVSSLEFPTDDEVLYTIHLDDNKIITLNNSLFFHHEYDEKTDKTIVILYQVIDNMLQILKRRSYKFDRLEKYILNRNLKACFYKKWLKYFIENF